MIDLTGRVFGMLTVIYQAAKTPGSNNTRWMCRCECGKEAAIRATRMLNEGRTHCGCLGYLRDRERHRVARFKIPKRRRVAIATLGAVARGFMVGGGK